MTTLDRLYVALAERFLASFPESQAQPRTVGRELEFPVVALDGQAADVRRLWELLLSYSAFKPKYDVGNPNLLVELSGPEGSYTIEVGVGTMEINTRPCRTLHEVREIAELQVSRLVHAAAAYGWRVLGYGIQPVTSPMLALMTPKQRYQSLYRAMGSEWLWYTVTAADQVHVAIRRDEVIRLLNFGNLMAPVIVALCANSPVYAGRLSPYCSAREGRHLAIHALEHRHGMPATPYGDAEEFVRRVADARHLIRKADNQVYPTARSFADYLADSAGAGTSSASFDALYEAFLFHEHYVWNSARARTTYGTLELRPACQQPWGEHMAAATLGVGLIEAHRAIEDYLEVTLGPATWETMAQWHRQVIRTGLAASQPAPNFLFTIVELAGAALRSRGHGEEEYLAPLYLRLERGENPAQRAQHIFASDGMSGLLAHAAIRTQQVSLAATR